MKRIKPGYYVQRENPYSVLHVFKFAGKWYYARQRYQVLSSNVADLIKSINGVRGYPTRAMALSASKGNRVP